MTAGKEQKPLTDDELEEAIQLAKSVPPGVYTLKELYGTKWLAKDPHGFGLRFKESDRRGHITGVEYFEDTSSHSAKYHVGRSGKAHGS